MTEGSAKGKIKTKDGYELRRKTDRVKHAKEGYVSAAEASDRNVPKGILKYEAKSDPLAGKLMMAYSKDKALGDKGSYDATMQKITLADMYAKDGKLGAACTVLGNAIDKYSTSNLNVAHKTKVFRSIRIMAERYGKMLPSDEAGLALKEEFTAIRYEAEKLEKAETRRPANRI